MIEIELTRGYKTIVDEGDKDLAECSWHATSSSGGHVYACHSRKKNGKVTAILLHRVILERKIGCPIPGKMKTDHINRDGLDNRRENLRLATHGQNIANSKRSAIATSPYRGVLQRASGKWRAQIMVNGKNLHIGTFDTPEQAAIAWNQSALLHRGEFARLNEIG